MSISPMGHLIVIGLFCALRGIDAGDVDFNQVWGNTKARGSIFENLENRMGIPFIRRELTFKFPEVNANSNIRLYWVIPMDFVSFEGFRRRAVFRRQDLHHSEH